LRVPVLIEELIVKLVFPLYLIITKKAEGREQKVYKNTISGIGEARVEKYSDSHLDAIQSRAGKPRPYRLCDLKLYLSDLKTAIASVPLRQIWSI
jgi:hypothetical protein